MPERTVRQQAVEPLVAHQRAVRPREARTVGVVLAMHGVAVATLAVTLPFVVAEASSPARVLLGCATAAALYLLAVRWGVWPWLAALASVPALLSPVAASGQHPVRDAAFVLVVTVASLLACWRSSRWLAWAAVGVALATAGAAWVLAEAAVAAAVVSGPGLALLVIGPTLAMAASLGLARARWSRMRMVVALTGLLPGLVLLGGIGSVGLTQAGGLFALTWWPVAGALGLTAMARGRRGRATNRPQFDERDIEAVEDFRSRYSDPSLSPLVVVIAAYNEAQGITAVLDELPWTVCGLDVDVLVVDDGSVDETADRVLAHGRARLVRPGVNRGQGAALRLGYRVAREHGAQYVVTTDADGQYDPADFALVVAPVLDGSADFVTGSRRLGGQETRDRVRRLGVHVFASVVSGLTGHWSTDTSFGLRAMRSEVTATVTLNQAQYQSSELLIGVLSHGYRVVEVPAQMRLRSAGASKKGRNLVYGSRYARAVLGTWWREGCPRPASDRAPALAGRPTATVAAEAERG